MAFPTTGILDTFDRANEDPVSTGWSGPTRPTGGQLKVLSNQLVRSTAGSSNQSWYTTSFEADCEVYFTVPTLPGSGGSVSVTARIIVPNTVNVGFYQFTYTVDTGYRMFAVTDNGYTQIGSTVAAPAMAAGDKLGLNCVGTLMTGWLYKGGAWQSIMGVTDATHAAGGFIGAEITDATAAVDNFGGGTVVVTASPSIYLPMGMLGTGRV